MKQIPIPSAAPRLIRNRSSVAALAALLLVGAGSILPLNAKSHTAPSPDKLPGLGLQPVEYFYTGKPYDADTETYTFKYRNYDPELNRWTTADPSGFPDGANNQVYCSNIVLFAVDPNGAKQVVIGTVGVSIWDITINNWGVVASGATAVAGVLSSSIGIGAAGIVAGLAGLGWSTTVGPESAPLITEIYGEVDDNAEPIGFTIVKDEHNLTNIDVTASITILNFSHVVETEFHWE